MGILVDTTEHPLYVPSSRKPEAPRDVSVDASDTFGIPNILGERPDALPADYGMDYLRREVSVGNGWFVFGLPPERATFVYQAAEGLLSHANLSPFLMFDFWHNTYSYAPGEALATAYDIMEVARGGLGARRTIFELPFATWDTEGWVDAYISELHKLFVADHPDSVLRDDRRDQGADPNNPHYTEVRMGLLGASTVLLITRSRIAWDERGREVIARLVELVKPTQESVDDILCELSLTEQTRLKELLRRAKATPKEWAYVINKADRRNMQRDHHSVRQLIEESHYVPKPPLWHKIGRGIVGLFDKMADTSFVRRIDEKLAQRRARKEKGSS